MNGFNRSLRMKKIGLLVLIAALAVGFFHFNLHQLLTLDGLKSGLGQFEELRTIIDRPGDPDWTKPNDRFD